MFLLLGKLFLARGDGIWLDGLIRQPPLFWTVKHYWAVIMKTQ